MRSKILSIAQKVELMNLCKLSHDFEWRLLYRASEDGFGSSKFHGKCDLKSNTLAIIKSTSGWIFGGYTDASWDQSNTYKVDSNAFLFSLTNRECQPVCLPIIPGKESLAIHGSAVSGVRFGGGADLIIADNSHNNSNSFTNLGHTYKHPTYSHGSNEAKCFFAGTYNFQVAEIEIYQKI